MVLGRLGDAQAIEPLIAALANENKDTRKAVVMALKQLGGVRIIELLIAVLVDKGQDQRVRQAAAETLGQMGDVRAVEPLMAALADQGTDIEVRGAAAAALGQLGDAQAIEPLIAALTDNSEAVRQAVVVALGRLGDTRAIEPLVAALTHEVAPIWETVREALEQLDRHWPQSAAAQAALPSLLAALADNNSEVRRAAAKALGQVGDARAVLPLVTCLNKTYGCEEWETDVIAEALTCVLETTVASITPEDLRLIAHCDDLPVLSFDGKELVYGSFSCIHIRQLARQELTRRGMGAEDDHAHG
jgi:HEAT repeat protein